MGEYGIRGSIAELSEMIMETSPEEEIKCNKCGHKRYNHNPKCKICECQSFGFKPVEETTG